MNYPSYLIMITEDVINKLNSSNKNDNNKGLIAYKNCFLKITIENINLNIR